MLCIDAVPALRDGKVRRSKEAPNVVEDELVEAFLVEDIDRGAVFVRIAESELA